MKRILVISMLVLVAITVMGCNTASKKIDTYLNGLEVSVANDEKSLDAGESVLENPIDVVNKYESDLSIGVDQYKILTEGKPEQQKKYADIKNRIDVLQSRLSAMNEEPVEEVEIPTPNTPATPNRPPAKPVVKPTETVKPVDNQIDKLLNSYEAVVETYEGSKLGMKDVAKISTKLAELKKQTDGVDMTEAQMERLGNLTVRFTRALQKARGK